MNGFNYFRANFKPTAAEVMMAIGIAVMFLSLVGLAAIFGG